MKRYHYLKIGVSDDVIEFYCSDPQTKDWIVSEIKKVVPNCAAIVSDYAGIQYYHLQKKSAQIADSVLKQLFQLGWEPFAVSGAAQNLPLFGDRLHLRFEIP